MEKLHPTAGLLIEPTRCAWEIGGHNSQKVFDSLSAFGVEIQHAEKLFAVREVSIISSCSKYMIKVTQEPNKSSSGQIACFTEVVVDHRLCKHYFISVDEF